MYEYEKPEIFKKKSYPLFGEHARKTDPQASHDRAKKLSGSMKLTKQMLLVLKIVKLWPDETARELGVIMSEDKNMPDYIELPHKVASRLEKAGWIVRAGSPYLLRITPEGEKQLKENSNE